MESDISYHDTPDAAKITAEAELAKLCSDRDELDMGWGKESDYTIALEPSIDAKETA